MGGKDSSIASRKLAIGNSGGPPLPKTPTHGQKTADLRRAV
jgi:hypothetical protein